MKRLGIYALVLMVGAGFMAMGACGGGGGGGGDGLPRSSAAYAGSSHPAIISSTDGWDIGSLSELIYYIPDGFWGGSPSAETGSDVWEGTISGTYTYTWDYSSVLTPTVDSYTDIYTGTYSNYADSGDTYGGVLKGSGNWYTKYKYREDWDGVEVVPTGSGVGTQLGWSEMFHLNYSAFAESTGSNDTLMAGYITINNSEDYNTGTDNDTVSANISESDFVNEIYKGLLGATSTWVYDGSGITTYVASGTLCIEGDEGGPEGCLDYDVDLQWEDEGEASVSDWPYDGTIEVSTMDASAMVDYSYTSEHWCFLFSLDADNDSAYEFTSLECSF